MGATITTLLFLSLIAVVIIIVVYGLMYGRKRGQASQAEKKVPRKDSLEHPHRQIKHEIIRDPEEDKRQQSEAKGDYLKNDSHEAPDEHTKVDEKDIHPEDDIHHEFPDADKRVEPSKRGGRPRAAIQEQKEQPTQETKIRRPKPEIICWKRERRWILAVELPEDLIGNSALAVLQNASILTEDEQKEGCWLLKRLTGQVTVRWEEEGTTRENILTLGKENHLLFKLSGQDQNRGRYVKSPSTGSYLVVVPDSWDRDEVLSGVPPVSPESVFIPGYQAHFYMLDKNNDGKIAFRTPDNETITIESKAPRFKLVGKLLDDATENMGPLFGMIPPKIRALSEEAWTEVETVVVGDEGSGKGRWCKSFSPVQGLTEQDLPSEISLKKAGWYFLRFYDANDDLIESLDFRYAQGLKDISILQPPPLPLKTGHATASVEFLHDRDCEVHPADDIADSIQAEQKDGRTILAIPPNPACDKTRWLVGPQKGPQTELHILVERLWWSVGKEDEIPCKWGDTQFNLLRSDFAATSNKAIWVRFPRPRWIDAVLVGFEHARSTQFSLKVAEDMIAIPFREFADTQEVADRINEHHLTVWIKRDDALLEGVIATIPADPLTIPEKESPITEVRKDSSEKKPTLIPVKISTPRLATMLTKLRRMSRGPLRILIKEIRCEYPKRRAARQTESVEFEKNALCMLAFYLELLDEGPSKYFGLRKTWIEQAYLAKDEFPEVISRLKGRYKELNSRHAH